MNRSKKPGGAGRLLGTGPGARELPPGLAYAVDDPANPELTEARRVAIEMGEARFAAIKRGYARLEAARTHGPGPEAVALAGWRAGRPLRETAVELYGRNEVEARWHRDSAMRSRVRRLLARARANARASDGAGPEDGGEADTGPDREADMDPDFR